jgi:c-di-GMP-binding flagellar brake protein YcgR
VAVFAPTPTLARVRDISLGGLGLEYLEGRPADRDWNEVNLFFAGSRHYLPSLPLKVVYDRGKDEQGLLQTRLHKRFCGVEFGELAPHQATQLQSLITNLAPPV